MKLPNPYTQRKLAEARDLPPRNGPFAAFNIGFHETYTRLVEQVLAKLGDSVPVVVLIGDDATLLSDGGNSASRSYQLATTNSRRSLTSRSASNSLSWQTEAAASPSSPQTSFTKSAHKFGRHRPQRTARPPHQRSHRRLPPSCCAAHARSLIGF